MSEPEFCRYIVPTAVYHPAEIVDETCYRRALEQLGPCKVCPKRETAPAVYLVPRVAHTEGEWPSRKKAT